MRALLKLGGRCNNDCVFCHAGGSSTVAELPRAEVGRRILRAKAAGCDEVVFSGGEPTSHPDLLSLAAFARRAGLSFGLVSNGGALADAELRKELLALGMSYLQISLHGPDASTHDALSGVASFERAVAAIEAFAHQPLELGVTTVVCRGNLHFLDDTVGKVSRLLDRPQNLPRPTHRLCLLEPKGRAKERRDLWPELPVASAAVARALAIGRRRFGDGVRRGYDGFPRCLAPASLSSLDDLGSHRFQLVQETLDDGLYAADEGRRAYGEPCKICHHRPRCPGVYEGYFPFASDFLRPSKRPSPSAWSFVAVGEIAATPGSDCAIAQDPSRLHGVVEDAQRSMIVGDSRQGVGVATLLVAKEPDLASHEIVRLRDLEGRVHVGAREGGERDEALWIEPPLVLDPLCIQCRTWGVCPGVLRDVAKSHESDFDGTLTRQMGALKGRVVEVLAGSPRYGAVLARLVESDRISYLGVGSEAKTRRGLVVRRESLTALDPLKRIDAALLLWSLNREPEPERALELMASLLAEGGCLVLADSAPILVPARDGAPPRARESSIFTWGLRSGDVTPLLEGFGLAIEQHIPIRVGGPNAWMVVARRH